MQLPLMQRKLPLLQEEYGDGHLAVPRRGRLRLPPTPPPPPPLPPRRRRSLWLPPPPPPLPPRRTSCTFLRPARPWIKSSC